MTWLPNQLSLVLGIPKPKIMDWVDKGFLPATKGKRTVSIDEEDLVRFLHDHPDQVGRVYCNDIPGYLDKCRKNLVNKLEAIPYANKLK